MNLTKGLGAGAKHDIGQAADESLNEIVTYLQRHGFYYSWYGRRNRNRGFPCYCKSCERIKYINSWSYNFTFLMKDQKNEKSR